MQTTEARTVDPVLRATTGTGDVYDDPSEDLLFILFEDFEEAEPAQRWFRLREILDRVE